VLECVRRDMTEVGLRADDARYKRFGEVKCLVKRLSHASMENRR